MRSDVQRTPVFSAAMGAKARREKGGEVPAGGVGQRFAIVGPFPPPRHGVSAVNESLEIAGKREGIDVRRFDTAPPSLDRSMKVRLKRIGRVARAAVGAWKFGREHRSATVYLSLSGGAGLVYEAVIAAAARLGGAAVAVHHHSFRYIDASYWGMRLLVTAAGPGALHIGLSVEMGRRLAARYPAIRRMMALSNAAFVSDEMMRSAIPASGAGEGGRDGVAASEFRVQRGLGAGDDAAGFGDASLKNTETAGSGDPALQGTGRGLRVGYLANLSREKGMIDVLELARRSQAAGLRADFVVAGPFESEEVAIEFRCFAIGLNKLDCIGAVMGEAKDAFFRRLDVFIFPTRYRHEAEPLVVLEALCRGVPVIAYGRGTIPQLLANGAGVAVSPEKNFAVEAMRQIGLWTEEREIYHEARAAARRQFEKLHNESVEARRELLRELVGAARGRGN